ncbi:hypothetical protein [Plebeiibacterium marinum]|uniref:DUF1735 domain-containing protein n=1 Tax=Plebeiibacterium marinum TaxID=2992111 RepID=A0AAE3MF27_9BACT|nr:hypothetical protein [Plebeiobacterium marinum]MCW3806653.1 hypothetical protein [Plebeiobacterium marinum]
MKKLTLLSMVITLSFLLACHEDTFNEDSEMVFDPPVELEYLDIIGAREGQSIRTFAPSVNTGMHIPYFEIVKLTDADGTVLGDEYLKDVSILNPEVEAMVEVDDYDEPVNEDVLYPVNYKEAGTITIADGNVFTHGDYYFDIKVITSPDDSENRQETVFERGFHLNVGPALAEDLMYVPLMQNLLFDGSKQTTVPFTKMGNKDVRFELGSDLDVFSIDSETGVITIKPGSSPEAKTYYPQVNVISNISEESISFQGEAFFGIVVSETPVALEPQTIQFFYPTLQAENTLYGYRKFVIDDGGLADSKIWVAGSPCNLVDDRPESASGAKSIMTNIVVGGQSLPHNSWVVINPQNLYTYSQGFDLSAIFWVKNQYVEYMEDGRTPTDLEVYVSADYTNSVENATWTQVNDILSCEINNSGNVFTGTPYPGDQQGDNPDGLKDPSQNADAKWVKCILDLESYKEEKSLTLAFKFASYFEGAISGATGRGGRYYISDVQFQATEIPQE